MAAAQRRIVWPLNSRSTTTSPVAHPERRCTEARRSQLHISGQLQVLNRAEMPKRISQKRSFLRHRHIISRGGQNLLTPLPCTHPENLLCQERRIEEAPKPLRLSRKRRNRAGRIAGDRLDHLA